jgi:hypothetical protein
MRTADEIAGEVESFYRTYLEIYNREDVEGFTRCFAFPYGLISGERGLAVCASAADHQRGYRRTQELLKQRGWGRTALEAVRGWALADDLAMIMADVTRYKTDGAVLETGRYCYTLRRDGDQWKIVTICEVKAPFRGPGEHPRQR